MTDVMSRGRLLNAELMGIETWTISNLKSTTSILPGTQKRDEWGDIVSGEILRVFESHNRSFSEGERGYSSKP